MLLLSYSDYIRTTSNSTTTVICYGVMHKWEGRLTQRAVCLCVHVCYGKGKGGGAVHAVQHGRYCMDINHQEKPAPVVAVDGWGVSAVMSSWQMNWPCWQKLAHRLSFQLVPHPRTHLTHRLQETNSMWTRKHTPAGAALSRSTHLTGYHLHVFFFKYQFDGVLWWARTYSLLWRKILRFTAAIAVNASANKLTNGAKSWFWTPVTSKRKVNTLF